MKTTKQKHRNGFMLIEVIVSLLIAMTSIMMIRYTAINQQASRVDMSVFISMMQAVAKNEAQPIVIDHKSYNIYYPTHAFSRSYTQKFDTFTIVFHIGRGYYAIKKGE